MLEGGCSYVAVNKDCICKKMEKKIGAANDIEIISEVKILQHAKQELEQQLKGKKLIKVDNFYNADFFNLINLMKTIDIYFVLFPLMQNV